MHVIGLVKTGEFKNPTFQGSGTMGDRERGEREKWAKIWFASLATFHHVDDPGNWAFTDQEVIAFLRSCLASCGK